MEQEYQKYEFCQAMDCEFLYVRVNNFEETVRCEHQTDDMCPYSAKEFHHWLKENGYTTLKIKEG